MQSILACTGFYDDDSIFLCDFLLQAFRWPIDSRDACVLPTQALFFLLTLLVLGGGPCRAPIILTQKRPTSFVYVSGARKEWESLTNLAETSCLCRISLSVDGAWLVPIAITDSDVCSDEFSHITIFRFIFANIGHDSNEVVWATMLQVSKQRSNPRYKTLGHKQPDHLLSDMQVWPRTGPPFDIHLQMSTRWISSVSYDIQMNMHTYIYIYIYVYR
jgi:hypothetical protein